MSKFPTALLDAPTEIDIGPYGYRDVMYVYRNDPGTPDILAKGEVTIAYAQAVLSSGASLVGFSSSPDGTGCWVVLPMHPDDAAKYPLGSRVTFHNRKIEKIGYGDLVAITPLPKED